ncbi:GTP-binding protein [Desulfovibrio sp. OttesenSCG-928-O18]|nr:GTP-binding protein [Desulfovibrio sp. OttesenSCG-928-O18]
MISKKVCLLGAFSVGKTSLVEQYVHSIFTDKYLSTVGVKISKKNLSVEDKDVTLILWDMEGKDLYAEVNLSYLRGAMGYFVVMDGTRRETAQIALELHKLASGMNGSLPCYFLINKADIADTWEITDDMIADLEKTGVRCLRTSARTGEGVEEAFACLARDMVNSSGG